MIIIFNKSVDSNIISIDCDGMDGDIFNWAIDAASSHIIDSTNFKLKAGATDVTVTFNSLIAMKPYIDTFNHYHTLSDPITNGVITNPGYGQFESGTINPHTYVDTNIEQDLINGDA